MWGYPLAHRIDAFPKALAVKGIGYNSFQRFERLKTADDRFVVTPNNLTVDSYAIFDVTDGPVVVFVPKLAERRWFIVQLGDAFDDVILNVGGSREPVPGTYLLTGPDYHGRVPGDMIQVRSRTTLGFAAVRVGVHGTSDLAGALVAQAGFHMVPLHRYLVDGVASDSVSFGPIDLPALTAPDDLELFDLLGAALQYMFPVDADVTDTFVQALATIGLSVGRGFEGQSLDESVLAGLRRAAPMVDRIIDERWATMSEMVIGWRGSLASGRLQLRLVAQRRQHQEPGRHRARRSGRVRQHPSRRRRPTTGRYERLRLALRGRRDAACRGDVEHGHVRRRDVLHRQRHRSILDRQHHRRPGPQPRRLTHHLHPARRSNDAPSTARPASVRSLGTLVATAAVRRRMGLLLRR